MENIASLIDKIKTYEEYCSFIEENYVDRQYNTNLSYLKKHIANLNIEEKSKRNIQVEIDCFYFFIENGQLKPFFIAPDRIHHYPDLENFTDDDIEYLKKRVDISNNDSLKARFSLIIWKKTQEFHYGQIAISSYLSLLNYFEKQKDEEYEWGRIFELAAFLSIRLNHKVDQVKNVALKILNDKNASSRLRMKVIGFLSANRSNKEIKKDFDLNKLENACEEIYQEESEENIIKLGREVSKDKNKWIRREAEFWEERAEGTDSFSASFAYQHAIPLYRQIGDKDKVDELHKKYVNAIHQSVHKEEQRIKIEKEKLYIIEKLVFRLDKDGIIRKLIKLYVPDYKEKEEMAKYVVVNSIFLSIPGIVSQQILDKFGNKVGYAQLPEERIPFFIGQFYCFEICYTGMFLFAFIKAAIKQSKISGEILIKYLEQNSWIGRIIKKRLPKGETLEYKWIDEIKEPIMSFFNKLEKFIKKEADYPNLIMETDSLVLKIEGMLRDIFVDKDLSTYYYNNKGNFSWKNINNYLEDPKIEQVLSKNDIEFMKYFLINKEYGYNLRNNIAHCLMFPNEYGIDTFLCLIITILRLSLYAMQQDA